MRFEFGTASRILFGPGVFQDVATLAKALGTRVFIVRDPRVKAGDALAARLESEGLRAGTVRTTGEPSTQSVAEAVGLARASASDLVVGLGGGSALDTAKGVAALLANSADPMEYLEVVGRGKPLANPAVAWIAVPTTAGTGAEATANAVLTSAEHRIKASLRHPSMLARVAVVDPELTVGVPPDVTAATGLDALTQLIEPFVCKKTNALVDALCRDGIPRAGRSLVSAFRNGNDLEARENLSLAALFSGMALSNATLGAVHGIAGPLGGMLSVAHGQACARLLPCVMEVNTAALRRRMPGSASLQRYGEIGEMLTGQRGASAEDGIAFIRMLVSDMQVPALAASGLTPDLVPDLIQKAKKASSMKGNPVDLTDDELMRVLEIEAGL